MYIVYGIIFVVLLALELVYFRVADRFNIIDKPNERSSHSTIVLRGGGIIFLLGIWVWAAFFGLHYPLFLAAVTIAAGISFIDDIHSLPDSVRLIVQFVSMALILWQLYLMGDGTSAISGCSWIVKGLFLTAALIAFVGAADVYNFMDGINGITAGYSLAVLIPLMSVNTSLQGPQGELGSVQAGAFVEGSLLVVVTLAVVVFSIFNFRGKGKAKCFAGDVGSVGIAYILLFAIGMLIVRTGDVTWLIFVLVYGVDGCLTIVHRIMLHENLGEAHRKHAYQLMANELEIGHLKVSLLYMVLQLAVSLGFIYLCPNTEAAHWIYLCGALVMLAVAYVLFMKKYYHLHEEYLAIAIRNKK